MFARVIAVVVASSFILSATAEPSRLVARDDVSQCNGGYAACCNQAQSADSLDDRTGRLLNLLGVDVANLTGLVGTNCSPLTGLGVGSGSSCSTQQVCCENNSFNGLVVVGCTPINVAL